MLGHTQTDELIEGLKSIVYEVYNPDKPEPKRIN
jgi:hypothetical protein